MAPRAWIFRLLVMLTVLFLSSVVHAQQIIGDGEGVDSQLLWVSPGCWTLGILHSTV